MKKLISIAALVVACGLAAWAGFDQYAGKGYTKILAPTRIANSAVAITNTPANAVSVAGRVGNGCLVFAYQCNNASGATLSFQVLSSATTNGTYKVYTNASGVSAWAYTNSAGFATLSFRPGSVSRYLRAKVTPTAVTNGVCGVLLVTE